MRYLIPVSKHQIVYKSPGGQEGLLIQGKVYSPPNFTIISSQTLTELDDGLYYLDADFSVEGDYIVNINGSVETYRISRSFR